MCRPTRAYPPAEARIHQRENICESVWQAIHENSIVYPFTILPWQPSISREMSVSKDNKEQ